MERGPGHTEDDLITPEDGGDVKWDDDEEEDAMDDIPEIERNDEEKEDEAVF